MPSSQPNCSKDIFPRASSLKFAPQVSGETVWLTKLGSGSKHWRPPTYLNWPGLHAQLGKITPKSRSAGWNLDSWQALRKDSNTALVLNWDLWTVLQLERQLGSFYFVRLWLQRYRAWRGQALFPLNLLICAVLHLEGSEYVLVFIWRQDLERSITWEAEGSSWWEQTMISYHAIEHL